MEKSVHDYVPLFTDKTSYFSGKPLNVELYMATTVNPPTTEKLTGWKSLRPNHRKLITSNKMAAVTKIGVSSCLPGTEKNLWQVNCDNCKVIVPTWKNDFGTSSDKYILV